MADDSHSLVLHVRTVGDTSGAAVVTDAINKSKDATHKSSEATEEHTHKILGLNVAAGEQRKVLRELAEAFPGLLDAARLAIEPEIALIGLLAAGLVKVREAFAEFDKQLDEIAAKNAEREFLPGIEAKRDKVVELEHAMGAYVDKLDHLISREEAYNTTLTNQAALKNAIAAADAKIAAAKAGADEAAIDADPTLTQAQKDARKAQIKLGAENAANQPQAVADKTIIDQLLSSLEKAHVGLATATPDREAAEKAQLAQLPIIDQAKRDADEAHKAFEKAQGEVDKKQKEFDDLKREMDDEGGPGPLDRHVLDSMQEEINKAKGEADKQFDVFKQNEHKSEAADTTTAPLDRAKATETNFLKVIQEFPEKMKAALDTQSQHQKGAAGSFEHHARQAVTEFLSRNAKTDFGGITGGGLNEVFKIQEKVRNNEALTKMEQDELRSWTEYYNYHKTNHDSQLRFLDALMGHLHQQTKRMDDIVSQLNTLRHNTPGS